MGFAQAVFIRSFFTLHMSVQYRAGASITSLLLMALYGSGVGAGFLKARERYHALNPTATCVLNGQQLPRDGCMIENQCNGLRNSFWTHLLTEEGTCCTVRGKGMGIELKSPKSAPAVEALSSM
jgi:hypothetical protein